MASDIDEIVDDLLEGCPTAPSGPEPNPTLRRVKAVLNHPIGDYAVQPKEATMAAQGITMAHYAEGASYTVGSTQNISMRVTSILRNFGGEVFCDATVEEIIIERGRAVGVKVRNTSAGEGAFLTEIRAKNVVCATSTFNLHNKLLPPDHPSVKDFFDKEKRTITESNGHVFLFVKLKGDASELNLPTHNLVSRRSFNCCCSVCYIILHTHCSSNSGTSIRMIWTKHSISIMLTLLTTGHRQLI